MASDRPERETEEPTEILGPDEAEEWPVAEQYRIEPPAASPTEADPDEAIAPTPAPTSPSRRRRFPADPVSGLIATIAAAILAIGITAWALTRDGAGEAEAGSKPQSLPTDTTPTTRQTTTRIEPVPDVVGRQLREARSLLERAGLRIRIARQDSSRPEGEVLEQAPAAGMSADADSVVVLAVSRAAAEPELVSVPRLEGTTVSAASAALRKLELRPEIRLVSSSRPAGIVVSQDPGAGAEVEARSVVSLDVARPPTRIDVPDLVGTDVAEARSRLRELGLTSAVVSAASSEPKGTVVRQSPGAGAELRKGGTVTLRISSGPATVAVPDVTGLDAAAAQGELESAGFVVQIVDEPTTDPAQDGIVVGQSPTGGSELSEGATVTLTVARVS